MHYVGGRVSLSCTETPLRVNYRLSLSTDLYLTAKNSNLVREKAFDWLLNINYFKLKSVAADKPCICSLATGFCIERSLVDEQLTDFTLG